MSLDESLAECLPLARVLYMTLSTIADREGRLEDRPARIKAQLLPYDKCDCSALLDNLVDKGQIVRFEAEGMRVIQIVRFKSEQNPHSKENESMLPGLVATCRDKSSLGSHALYKDKNKEENKEEKEESQRETNPQAVTVEPIFPPNLDMEPVRDAWERWLAYKRAINKPYKLPRTQRQELKKWVDRGPERLIAAIDHSIDREWTGIFEKPPEPRNGIGRASKHADLDRELARHDQGRNGEAIEVGFQRVDELSERNQRRD